MSRVAVSGRVARNEYQNLLTFPEAFDNAAWNKTNATITPDQIANPIDGTVNADLFVDSVDAGPAGHFFGRSVALTGGGVYTFSCYFKSTGIALTTSGNPAFVSLQLGVGLVGFDLVNGLAQNFTSAANVVRSSITAVTGQPGWYRAQVSFVAAGTSSIFVQSGQGIISASYKGTGQPCFYLYGAQVNRGLTASPYLPGQTAALNSGLSVRQARQEYQNLLTFPEAFDNGVWSKLNSSITPNQIANPITGAVDADLFTDSTDVANVNHALTFSQSSLSVGGVYCMSIFVRSTGISLPVTGSPGNKAFFGFLLNNTGLEVSFDPILGTSAIQADAAHVLSLDAIPFGPNWFRCYVGFINTANGTNRIESLTGFGNHSYMGSATPCFYLYGAQINGGKYPSPYLPGQTAAVNTGGVRLPVSGRIAV